MRNAAFLGVYDDARGEKIPMRHVFFFKIISSTTIESRFPVCQKDGKGNGLMDGPMKTDGTEFIEYYYYYYLVYFYCGESTYFEQMFFINKSEIRQGQGVKIVQRAKLGIKSADAAGEKPTRAGSLFQRLTFHGLSIIRCISVKTI